MNSSKRVQGIDVSGIRRMFEMASQMDNAVDLSIGVPSFEPSSTLIEAASQAMKQGVNSYTPSPGIKALRDKIKTALELSDNSKWEVMITSGVSGGLMLSYLSLFDPGDEVLIPDPYFCIYKDLASLLNVKPVCFDCYPDFKLSAEKLEHLVTPKTKAIVLGSPGNPTGMALSKKSFENIRDLAERADLWLVIDEIYKMFSYDTAPINFCEKYHKSIVLGGFSKSHGIPGWRLGYAAAPAEIINEMIKVQQYTFVCAPSFSQYALTRAFEVDEQKIVSEYREKRDFVCKELAPYYEFIKPDGAYYVFINAPGKNASKFVESCIQKGLLVVPGNVFSSQDTHFRLSFSASKEALEKGVEILIKLRS